jgi:hypothetical protein
LIEAGKSPHRQLRFTPKVGDKFSKTLTTKMKQTMTVAGQPAPQVDIPDQKMLIVAEVKKISSNGEIDYEYSYDDIEVVDDPKSPSPIAGQMRTMLQPLIGAKGSMTITNRGLTKKSEFETPENLNPLLKSVIDGMKDAMNQLSLAVPEEAVGVGGKWKTVQQLNANGISLKQTSNYEVTSMDANKFKLKVTIEQGADPQEVKNPMIPGTMKVESLKSNGDGETLLSFGGFFPSSTSVKISSKSSMSISVVGQVQKIATDTNLEMTLDDAAQK